MKPSLLLLLMFTVNSSSAAEWEPLNASANQTVEQHCRVVGTFAGLYMKMRQLGMPLGELMQDTDSPLNKEIIMSAFEQPKFSVAENRDEIAVEFESQWMLKCLQEHPSAN